MIKMLAKQPEKEPFEKFDADDDRVEYPLVESLLHIDRTFSKQLLDPGSLNSEGQGYSPNKVHHLLIR